MKVKTVLHSVFADFRSVREDFQTRAFDFFVTRLDETCRFTLSANGTRGSLRGGKNARFKLFLIFRKRAAAAPLPTWREPHGSNGTEMPRE